MEIYVHFIQQLLFFWHFYYTMYHVTFKESNKEHSSAHSDPSGLYFFFLLRSTPVGQKPVSEQKAAFRSVFFWKGMADCQDGYIYSPESWLYHEHNNINI